MMRRAKDALKSADHFVGRLRGTRQVLVDARTPMNLAVMRPMWRSLLDDPRIRLTFTTEHTAEVADALDRDGLRRALTTRDAVKWKRIDLAMTADAWNDPHLRRCRRRINFFHGVAGKYDLDHPERLNGTPLNRFDRLAFINRDRLERYVRSGVIKPERGVLVGFPKLDDLVNGAWPADEVRRELGLSPWEQTVLYAPTFSTASCLQAHGEAILQSILDTGRNVIVKLHDRAMVPHPTYTANIDWPARLRGRFGANPRFALAHAPDAGPFLSAADVLVTDHSTVGFEFALLDRPLIVYDAPALKEAARIDAEKWDLLRSMGDVVNSPQTLAAAVNAAFASPQRYHDARRRAHDLFAYAGSATGRALALVYELLDLEPSAVAAHSRVRSKASSVAVVHEEA